MTKEEVLQAEIILLQVQLKDAKQDFASLKEQLSQKDECIVNLNNSRNEIVLENEGLKEQLAAKEKECEKLKELHNYILDIDWLTTTEFCNKFNVPNPRFTGEVESSVNEMLRIDAVKHRMFLAKAKEYNKSINTPK